MKNLVVKQEHEPKFIPINVSFTLESEAELKELWNRFNLSLTEIKLKSKITGYPLFDNEITILNNKTGTYALWKLLNDIIKQTCRKNT